MARFIPLDKLKNLREAARNGDVHAKHILQMQLADQDFSSDLDNYFKAPETKQVQAEQDFEPNKNLSKLEQYLQDNGVRKGDEDYDLVVEEFYKEFPEENPNKEDVQKNVQEVVEEEKEEDNVLTKLKKEEIDAMNSYSKAITEILNDANIEETQKKRIIARLKEIRSDEEEHFRELTELEGMLNGQNDEEIEKAPQE